MKNKSCQEIVSGSSLRHEAREGQHDRNSAVDIDDLLKFWCLLLLLSHWNVLAKSYITHRAYVTVVIAFPIYNKSNTLNIFLTFLRLYLLVFNVSIPGQPDLRRLLKLASAQNVVCQLRNKPLKLAQNTQKPIFYRHAKARFHKFYPQIKVIEHQS